MSNEDGKLLYRPEEAAEAISTSRATVYKLMDTGQLRSVKIGASRRVPRAALAEFVAALEAEPLHRS